MEANPRNIYKNARRTAGFTQERWAELIGISPESVRLYESGRGLPSDDVVAKMVEVAGMPVLGYWHLKEKSGMANDMLPDLEVADLPQAVLALLVAVRDISGSINNLIQIAADGIVDSDEHDIFMGILDDLDDVVRAALAVKYARYGREDGGNE